MKNFIALAGFCIALVFTSCTHKSNVLPSTNNPVITVGNPATGDWTVILYTNGGADETPDFADYTFTFSANGVFTATRSTLSIDGTWQRKAEDGGEKLILNISSATDSHLAELNEDWVISLMTNSNINLVDSKGQHELKFQLKD